MTSISPKTEQFLDSLPPKLLSTSKRTKLINEFGSSLEQALSSQSPCIGKALGDNKATELFVAWDNFTEHLRIAAWLKENNLETLISSHTITAIIECHENPLCLLRETPYALLGLLEWNQVERLAQTQGIAPNTPQRLCAAVQAALYARLEEGGHTWTDTATLQSLTQQLLNLNISTQDFDRALKSLQQKGEVVHHNKGWQTGGCWQMEQDVLDIAHSLAVRSILNPQNTSATEQIINKADTQQKQQHGYSFGESQKQAFRMILAHRFSMLAGYAGSGKTTALKGIADILHTQSQTIYVLALSARAAKRAGDAAGSTGKTIAGFLKQLSLGAIKLGAHCTIIIDEASMVDLPSLWKIMRRLNGAGLILVGDPGQLPPIGFGLTLHALLDNPHLPATHLDIIYRQDESTGIPYIANQVRQGTIPQLPLWSPGQTGVSHHPCQPQNVIAALKMIGRDLKQQGLHPNDIQILAPIKDGPAGVHHINQQFHEQKRRHTQNPLIQGRTDIAVDDPVIWTKNTPKKQLWNGSLGRISKLNGNIIAAHMDGQTYELTPDDAKHLELAYALSVHRAQGSQWHTILLPVYPSKNMNRSLLYTALTRATHSIILIGNPFASLNAQHLPSTGTTKFLPDTSYFDF